VRGEHGQGQLLLLMTGPVPAAGGAARAGKKRRASEAAAAAPGSLALAAAGGSLADVSRGVGSAEEPLSFAAVSDRSAMRVAATSFFQLLVLKSWDIIEERQDEAYGDILITRTARFAEALEDHK
jgi:hypothetical protein